VYTQDNHFTVRFAKKQKKTYKVVVYVLQLSVIGV